jgi:hypothetical protein
MTNESFKGFDKNSLEQFIDFLQSRMQHVSDIELTDYDYAHYDGKFLSASSINIYFELKGRNFSSEKYGDMYLEQYKYDNLIKMAKGLQDENYRIWYVNIFTDGVVAILDIERFNEYNWRTDYANTFTARESDKMHKQVDKIPLYKCQIFEPKTA